MSTVVRCAAFALLSCCITGVARAEPLRIDQSAETMRVDGALREWKGARFATLGAGDDAALRFALASQADGLYVAAEVHDEQLVRKAAAGAGQDALVLDMLAPSADGALRASEVWLHPGRVGREKALAGLRALSGKSAGMLSAAEIKVVEGPLSSGTGYVIEAFIPWRLVADRESWDQARAVLRYEDCDRPGSAPEAVLASSPEKKPEEWPTIVLGTGQLDLLATFLKAQGLSGVAPRFDARADVAGDATEERVVIVDKYVLVYGKHFKDGQSYSFFALPYSVGGGLVSAELIDLTGDGQAELFTRVRQANELGARVLASVLTLGEDRIAPLFSIELKKETRAGFIENELRFDKRARPKQLQVSLGRVQGLSQESYRESTASDVIPILLPWGELEASSYAFRDGKFVRVEQRENRRGAQRNAAQSAASVENARELLPTARAEQLPTGDAIADLIQAFERGAANQGAVRFQQEANLVGGTQRERIFVYQRRVIVTGPDLGPAGSYLGYGLPLRADDDLLSLESADLGSDGRAELLARYRQLGGDGVGHEMLVVLAVSVSASERGVRPLLVAEVARRQGDKAIINQVQVSAGVLAIAPGKAAGYTRESYPFTSEAVPGIERVLLPWADGVRRYRLDAGRLRAE